MEIEDIEKGKRVMEGLFYLVIILAIFAAAVTFEGEL